MKTKHEIKDELKSLRKKEAKQRYELSEIITDADTRVECLTDDMTDIALTEAQCEILEWVLEDEKDD